VEAVDSVGILQLKLYHMESIKKFPRGILAQVISLRAHDGERERAPDPGQSSKPQATSSKPQA